MKIFSKLYDITLRWARHRHAPYYLGAVSFAESSFFPIPVDVMLAPMVMSQRQAAWRFAAIAAITSVLGGLFGYLIGAFAFEAIEPWLQDSRYWVHYQTATQWLGDYGFWALFAAGFLPIPYKVATIAAGAMDMNLLVFTFASLVGRAARFYLVAALVYWGGPYAEQRLLKYIDIVGWAVVALGIVAWLVLRA